MSEFDIARNLLVVLPELGLTILAIVLLLMDSYLPKGSNRTIAYTAAIAMAALAATPLLFPPDETSTLYWGGMIHYDWLSQIFKVMLLFAGSLTCLIAVKDHQAGKRGEFYLIITIATLGTSLMAGSADLIMVFVALETLSIPLYVLAAFGKNTRSSEAGLKYFLYGSFASGILLYGFSFLYGFAGTTSLEGIASAIANGTEIVPILAALVMVLVGFGFKISAVPFHMWTPDVYEGAPTPVTAFLSVASKAGSFALLIRFLLSVFPADVIVAGQSIQTFWINLVVVLAVLSMTLGNVLALRQKNFKRMLAYSSIAQAGYTLVGVAALQSNSDLAIAAISFYMFMYIFTNLLAFGGLVLVSEATGSDDISNMAGLNRRNPWIALAITIGLLSLSGIPPAAGFFGKFFLFQAAVEANLVLLAIIGVLNAIVALYYYLVVIKVMYVDHHEDEDQPIAMPPAYAWALGLATVVVILLGTIAVAPIFDWARLGAQAIIPGF